MRYDESLPFQYDLKYQGKKKYRSNLADMKQDLMPHHLWYPVTKHLEIIEVKKMAKHLIRDQNSPVFYLM